MSLSLCILSKKSAVLLLNCDNDSKLFPKYKYCIRNDEDANSDILNKKSPDKFFDDLR